MITESLDGRLNLGAILSPLRGLGELEDSIELFLFKVILLLGVASCFYGFRLSKIVLRWSASISSPTLIVTS